MTKQIYGAKEEVPVVEPVIGGAVTARKTKPEMALEKWVPKTEIGKKVKSGEVSDIRQIIEKGLTIKEAEIVDKLLPNLQFDFILIGQAHGKFGGGKRRLIKQTQKKTAEGNKPSFVSMAVVGNGDGYVGVGTGAAKESMPAREKALRKAKTSIIQVVRGCGSWKCGCGEPHSLPFEVEGKAGSVIVKLMPAPKGAGLVTEGELKKLLSLAGYKDVWSKSWGQTRKKINFINATTNALRKLSQIKSKSGTKVVLGSLSA